MHSLTGYATEIRDDASTTEHLFLFTNRTQTEVCATATDTPLILQIPIILKILLQTISDNPRPSDYYAQANSLCYKRR